ncbi:MAG: hypothetical protein HY280_01040 [Nitrospinae bacterium]|nr:hypothetical protein [Nitrospinota bacterium]
MFKRWGGRVPWVAISAGVIAFFYLRRLLSLIPGPDGLLGVDWMLFLPWLLDGRYGVEAGGLFNVQWFTPSFCGGIPKFPDPQDQFFSVPQFFTFFMPPIESARLTVVIFALAGFLGFYGLMRKRFGFGPSASLAGAAVFLCNGYYSGGMVAGHLAKHPFMLLPLIAYFLFGAAWGKGRFSRDAVSQIAGAAVCIAYAIWAGAVVSVPVMLFAVVGLGFFAALTDPEKRLAQFFLAFAVSVVFAIALSAAKLSASAYFAQNFSRDFYPLPGVSSVGDLATLLFHSLFGSPSVASDIPMEGRKFDLEPYEFDYGVTFVPLAVFILSSFWLKGRDGEAGSKRINWAAIAGLLLMAVTPFALNYYSPGWNHLLKMTPIIKSSSTNIRWFALYIPLISAFTAAVLDRISAKGAGWETSGVVCALAVLLATLGAGRREEQIRLYNPALTTAAFKQPAPPIQRIELSETGIGKNDLLVHGASSMRCYSSMFGYRLEKMPFKTLHEGPALEAADGVLNVKNPACYVYPKENGCAPGDHFLASETDNASLFLARKPYDFSTPWRQRAADWFTLVAWFFWVWAVVKIPKNSIKN